MIGNPFPLKQNAGKSFQGSIVLGKGFVLTPERADSLIAKDPRNREVLFPYLNGDDLNNDPEQKPSRWVISFFDWSEERARTYPDCFEIIERMVKPERMKQKDKGGKEKWWQFLRPRNELYETISKLDQVMVVPLVSKYSCFELVPTNYVYMHKLGVIAINDFRYFGVLSSTLHNAWCWKNSSTLGAGTLNYSTTDCFETFPFPASIGSDLLKVSKEYHAFRKQLMLDSQMGLTKLYNFFHSQRFQKSHHEGQNQQAKNNVTDNAMRKEYVQVANSINYNELIERIETLRALHMQLDAIVLNSYGWSDIQLKHNFYELEYLPENDRTRYSIHPDARKEILGRLLKLNHQIHSNEESKKAKSSSKRGIKDPPVGGESQVQLF